MPKPSNRFHTPIYNAAHLVATINVLESLGYASDDSNVSHYTGNEAGLLVVGSLVTGKYRLTLSKNLSDIGRGVRIHTRKILTRVPRIEPRVEVVVSLPWYKRTLYAVLATLTKSVNFLRGK